MTPNGESWRGNEAGAQATHAKRRALIVRRWATICRARVRKEYGEEAEPDLVDVVDGPRSDARAKWQDTPDRGEHEVADLNTLQSENEY